MKNVRLQILEQFNDYHNNRLALDDSTSPWRNTDNAQLLYGGDIDGTTVGLAWVYGMCTAFFSTGLVEVSLIGTRK